MKQKFEVNYTNYKSTEELENADKELVEQAKTAAKTAYAPYSRFFVGAAIRLANGVVIKGSNQENAAYPSGLCAERVALFYANAEYPQEKVTAIAIAAFANQNYIDEPVAPCGSCRQALLETENRFETPIKIILYGNQSIRVIENAHQLLPFYFDEKFLP